MEASHTRVRDGQPASVRVVADRVRGARATATAAVRRRPLASLAAVAAELAAPAALERIAAVVAEAVSETLDASVLLLAIYDDAGRPVHVTGLPERTRRRPGAPFEEPGANELVLPIPPDGPALGVMVVGRGPATPFTADARAYLSVLAALTALAVERARPSGAPRAVGSHLRVRDMDIDLGEQRVVVGDRAASLTPSEIRLLLFLAEEPGRPRTRREILQHLWHTEHVGDERTCDAHISNLRRKIERDPSRPQRVVTVRGVGYALQPQADRVKVPSHTD